jgi:hypothetical protein
MRVFLGVAVVSISFCAMGAFAADNRLGTWKLNPDKSVSEGPIAPVPKHAVLKVQQDAAGGMVGTIENPGALSGPLPICRKGCTAVISPDGRTFTQTAEGTDPKSGRHFRSVLFWEKQ